MTFTIFNLARPYIKFCNRSSTETENYKQHKSTLTVLKINIKAIAINLKCSS